MKCPHCATAINENWSEVGLQEERKPPNATPHVWNVLSMLCPECGDFIARFRRVFPGTNSIQRDVLAWPKTPTRPVAPEVDERYANDFTQAVSVLPLSPKASAALSRRMLQDILREKASVTESNLDSEIQEVIDSGKAPSWVADNIDAVRVVGNFAAHPIKSTNTGEIVEVEPGEAEFLLDVLEGLFDFYFIQPEKAKQQRAAINAKLQDAGKPELKSV